MFALLALLVNLALLRSDKGAFVHIGMDFDVRVIAELQRILPFRSLVSSVAKAQWHKVQKIQWLNA